MHTTKFNAISRFITKPAYCSALAFSYGLFYILRARFTRSLAGPYMYIYTFSGGGGGGGGLSWSRYDKVEKGTYILKP